MRDFYSAHKAKTNLFTSAYPKQNRQAAGQIQRVRQAGRQADRQATMVDGVRNWDGEGGIEKGMQLISMYVWADVYQPQSSDPCSVINSPLINSHILTAQTFRYLR